MPRIVHTLFSNYTILCTRVSHRHIHRFSVLWQGNACQLRNRRQQCSFFVSPSPNRSPNFIITPLYYCTNHGQKQKPRRRCSNRRSSSPHRRPFWKRWQLLQSSRTLLLLFIPFCFLLSWLFYEISLNATQRNAT